MASKTYAIIPEDEYKTLLENAMSYEALRNGGVDNWEWCWLSIFDYISNIKNTFSSETIEKYRKDHSLDEDDELYFEDYVNMEFERAIKIHFDLSEIEN